ncbi:GspH/FimT family pseudopilin [Pararoseomonas indoligenes]|uniref:Type II secretion system protein H n=1 Tax=Roseomonas indoligenes TaxID=2820811 RepID=A0A940N1Q9_9PROT|nr:GspH/FimT family pseudopilin [Pararoseomonas indoligenes]MBP0494949.1 GspH/FimT family pseudopilin [Pararoseomonas indoligenes]
MGASRQAGFTLIEVLVVLAVIGLALGIVAGRGPARSPALEAREAAGEVALALRQARGLAIASNRRVIFVLDVARHAYRVDNGPVRPLPAALDLAMTAAVGEAGESRTATGIGFSPDGSSSGGRIRLAAGAVRRVVAVDWLTGRVSVADAP